MDMGSGVTVHQTDMDGRLVEYALSTIEEATRVHPRNFTHRCRAIVGRMKEREGGTWLATASRRKTASRFQYTKGSMLFCNVSGVNYQLYQAPPVTMERAPTSAPPPPHSLPSPHASPGPADGLDIRKSTLPEPETIHVVHLALTHVTTVSSDAAHNFRDALHEFYGAPWHVYVSSSANPAFVFGCYVVHSGSYIHVNLPGNLDVYAFMSTTGAPAPPPLHLSNGMIGSPFGRGNGGMDAAQGGKGDSALCSRSAWKWWGPLLVWVAFIAFVFAYAVIPATYSSMSGTGFSTFQGPWLCTKCSEHFGNCVLYNLAKMPASVVDACTAVNPHVARDLQHPHNSKRACFGSIVSFNQRSSYCEPVSHGFWVIFAIGLAFVVVNLIIVGGLIICQIRKKRARSQRLSRTRSTASLSSRRTSTSSTSHLNSPSRYPPLLVNQ